MTRCDELAAHPDDPTRAAPGVADERMAVKAAVSACTDAVKAAPQLARLHFQLGRALLEAKQVKESIAHFERAAAMNHGGAYVYLANAYEVGGGGLKKDAAKAADYARRGAQAGFGSGAAVGSAGAPAAGNVLADARELREKYEDGATMRAVYYGDASALSAEKLYVQAYLLGQVELLAAECNSFKMTEVREFRSSALRSQLPKTENEMAQLGWQQLANSLRVAANAMKNPQSMADVANREQRLEDAPAMGQKDLVTFVTRHGGCGTAPLERYTRNLRAYFSGGATKR